MFEEAEDPSDLFEEIEERGAGWRAEHLDLPVTLLFLSRIKRALPWLTKGSSAHETWGGLKTRGQSYARRRALFVAAEALGTLRRGMLAEEHETIRKAFGVVIEEGTTLHKVRALRALSLIPSDECIPILEKGLQDRSPWVQATALHTLINMDLRGRAPRKVLTDFLFERFRQQTRPEEALDHRAVVRNFHVNRGLFVGLLKVPGGKGLALLSLRLWAASTLLTAAVALGAATEVVIRGLRTVALTLARALWFVAVALLFKLPRFIITTPGLPRKTVWRFYKVFIWAPYKILTTPLWVRDVEWRFRVLGERDVYMALLDYVFVYLLVAAGLPYGTLMLAGALAVYWVTLAASGDIKDRNGAERYRLFIRCVGAALLAWYTGRPFQGDSLGLALWALAAAQAVWFLPLLARGTVKVLLFLPKAALTLWNLAGKLAKLMKSAARDGAEVVWESVPPREQLFREAAAATGKGFLTFWQNLRPHLGRLALRALGLVLLLAVAYYALRSFDLRPGDASKYMGPELGPLLLSLKPGLYFMVGGLVMAIPCAVVLFLFHLLWDELWIVERVTVSTRSKNIKRFKSDTDFLAYVFQIVRDQTLSTGLRVRAASALAQFPLASQEYVDGLTDLAEEDLPISVSDAVSKVAEDAEKRLKRNQHDNFQLDMDLVNRQLEDIWKPGELLRPRIRKALGLGVLLPSLAAGAAWLYLGVGDRLTDVASLACLGLGCGLVLLYMLMAGRQSEFVKWSLLYGLILLASVLMRPLQAPVYEAAWDASFENGVMALVELSTLSVLVLPAIVAGLVAQVGHTLYLLGSDADPNLELEGKPNIFSRKLKRLERQAFIVRPVLTFAMLAVLAQSQPVQNFLDGREATLPSFAAGDEESEVELRGIPADGRLVRVAMVRMDKEPDPKDAPGVKTSAADETLNAVTHSLKDGGLIPLEAAAVWGDVWLGFQDGELRHGWTSPIRCLDLSTVNADAATFNLHLRCTYDVKVRLVAVVYDKRRSDFVMDMPFKDPEQVDVNTVYSSDSWLLVDTVSPFVKSVWSPAF